MEGMWPIEVNSPYKSYCIENHDLGGLLIGSDKRYQLFEEAGVYLQQLKQEVDNMSIQLPVNTTEFNHFENGEMFIKQEKEHRNIKKHENGCP